MLKNETKDLILSQFAIGDTRRSEVETLFVKAELELKNKDNEIQRLKNIILDKSEEIYQLKDRLAKQKSLREFIYEIKEKKNEIK